MKEKTTNALVYYERFTKTKKLLESRLRNYCLIYVRNTTTYMYYMKCKFKYYYIYVYK